MKARIGLLVFALCAPAEARDNGQWGNSPTLVREWFQSLMQPDNPAVSCCGEADAFEADTFEVDGDHSSPSSPTAKVCCRTGRGLRCPIPR